MTNWGNLAVSENEKSIKLATVVIYVYVYPTVVIYVYVYPTLVIYALTVSTTGIHDGMWYIQCAGYT